jgi:hypothetical protein
MATSTLIQFLSSGEAAPGGPNRTQVETFIAGGTITAGDAVALDLSKTGADKALYVVEAPANAGAIVVGIALNSAVAEGDVAVAITGYVNVADVETGVAAGQALYVGATAGRLAAFKNAATSVNGVFFSAVQTGTGAAQNIAHGLGVVPDLVFAIPEDLNVATIGAYTVVNGAHTSTNAIFTVTLSKTYRVVAIRFADATKALGAVTGPVAVALANEAANKSAVFMLKRGF